MSGVKHTRVSGVHPDNTALRAVDSCGGTYTPAEEADGWANGHRNALASAMAAVGHADSITADLLEALEAHQGVSQLLAELEFCLDEERGEIERQLRDIEEQARAAIARARGEQSPNHSDQKEVGNG